MCATQLVRGRKFDGWVAAITARCPLGSAAYSVLAPHATCVLADAAACAARVPRPRSSAAARPALPSTCVFLPKITHTALYQSSAPCAGNTTEDRARQIVFFMHALHTCFGSGCWQLGRSLSPFPSSFMFLGSPCLIGDSLFLYTGRAFGVHGASRKVHCSA